MHKDHEKIRVTCLFIMTCIACLLFLHLTKAIMIPFVISVFTYFSMIPLLNWLQNKWKLSKLVALSVTLLAFSSVSFIFVLLFISSIQRFIDGVSIYRDRVLELTQTLFQLAEKLKIPVDATFAENIIRE
ncbi:MAG: AI-2E family transporter, partial [Bdellovibrionales bacterium]|nr:AI-2E family transporter [Bdellovibrionales bacterium]